MHNKLYMFQAFYRMIIKETLFKLYKYIIKLEIRADNPNNIHCR